MVLRDALPDLPLRDVRILATDVSRKVLAQANRNGFYYVLDRKTGRFLNGRAFARQNWTAGLDKQGRPIPLPPSEADQKGRLVYPSNLGATNWWPPTSVSRKTLV